MGIDALEERGSNNGEDDTAEPYIGTATPEQIAISTNLERVYEECMLDGIEESTANTLTIERVLGKRKELGIKSSSSSSTSKVGKSRLSSTRQEEMEVQMKLMQEQLQLKDDKVEKLEEQAQRNTVEMNQLKETMNKLLECLRQQGIQAEPSTISDNGGR